MPQYHCRSFHTEVLFYFTFIVPVYLKSCFMSVNRRLKHHYWKKKKVNLQKEENNILLVYPFICSIFISFASDAKRHYWSSCRHQLQLALETGSWKKSTVLCWNAGAARSLLRSGIRCMKLSQHADETAE